jgi:hypothetical protein
MQRTKACHPTCDSTSEPGSSTEKSDTISFSPRRLAPATEACGRTRSARTPQPYDTRRLLALSERDADLPLEGAGTDEVRPAEG